MNSIHPSGQPAFPVAAQAMPKTHPLMLAASVSVLFASATAIAYMFGLVGPQTRTNPAANPILSSTAVPQLMTAAQAAPGAAPLAAGLVSSTTGQGTTTVPQISSAPAGASNTDSGAVARSAAETSVPTSTSTPTSATRQTAKPVQVAPARSTNAPNGATSRAAGTASAPIVASSNTNPGYSTSDNIQRGAANPVIQAPDLTVPVPTNNYPLPAESNAPPIIAQAPVFNPAPASNTPVFNPPVASEPFPVQAQAVDPNIGTVTSIREEERRGGPTSGMGAVAGGAVGGVLANKMGSKGSGKVLATIVGAVGGGLIGNEIEKSQRKVMTYVTTVRMPDGQTRQYTYSYKPNFAVGDKFDIRNAPVPSMKG
jgi:outer membrane lipoprotein SlyB